MARRMSEASPDLSPVASSNGQSRITTPSTSVPTTPTIPARPSTPEARKPRLQEPNSFLTALAAQERRVLELREELQRAELDLTRLKRQWAAQEATRKKNEARQTEQMRPFKCIGTETTSKEEDDRNHIRRELDRRRSMSNNSRTSQRKVFAGSRHTRALSLLSTKTVRDGRNKSAKANLGDETARASSDALSTLSSLPELETSLLAESPSKELFKSPDKDMLLETGRQLVGDFRQGFWTFVEDLKQVTVGDENSAASHSRLLPEKSWAPAKEAAFHDKEASIVNRENPKAMTSPVLKEHGPSDRAESLRKMADLPKSRDSTFVENKAALMRSDYVNDSENEIWDDWGTPDSKIAEQPSSAAPSTPLSNLSNFRTNVK